MLKLETIIISAAVIVHPDAMEEQRGLLKSRNETAKANPDWPVEQAEAIKDPLLLGAELGTWEF